MPTPQDYVLGQSSEAARRLDIQDAHFADISEAMLDELALRPGDRVVELGCGAGSFSRRTLRRLGPGGLLIGVDSSQDLLDQARARLGTQGPAKFETVHANVAELGSWLDGADAVVARTMLHHIPMVEFVLGRLRAALRPGARIGFIEPDFRSPLARLSYLEATGRKELYPLRVWSLAINHLYEARLLSPAVGATLAQTLQLNGYRDVRAAWAECRSDQRMIDNMLMFYDEVRDRLDELKVLSRAEVEEQQRLLRALSLDGLPAVWGAFRVTATV